MELERIQNFNSVSLLLTEILILVCKFKNVPCSRSFELKLSIFFYRSFRTYIIILFVVKFTLKIMNILEHLKNKYQSTIELIS